MSNEITVERATPHQLKELGVEHWSPWDCGVETFDWEYAADETAYVQQGKVEVTTEHGQRVTFGEGDLVRFPRGLRCTWNVLEPIHKVYTFDL